MFGGRKTLLVVVLSLSGVWSAQAQATTTATKMVRYAQAELQRGVREIPDGSNKHPRIKLYVASTTPSWYGAPWCAYFVSWLAKRAGKPIGPGGKGLGYVPYIRSWAKNTKRWRTTPKPGDLIIFPQHVGLVERTYTNRTLTTIEGNAGNAVRRKWRRWADAMGYVRVGAGGGSPVSPDNDNNPKPDDSGPGQKLVARIKAYPGLTTKVGGTIDFVSQESTGDIVKVRWDLTGDGKIDYRGDQASHTYQTAGPRKIRLWVWDRKGRKASATETVTVQSVAAPTAQIKIETEGVIRPGQKVTLSAEESSDPDGRIVSYEWDANGDGQFGKGGDHTTMTYPAGGVYRATVRVTDNDGLVSEASMPVTVTEYPAPKVTVFCPTVVPVGQKKRCATDVQAEAGVASREWDVSGSGEWVSGYSTRDVVFGTPGDQLVRMRVTDRRGQQTVAETQVKVTNQAPQITELSGPASIAIKTTGTWTVKASDPEGAKLGYEWDSRDDGFSSGWQSASFSFEVPGTYTVRVQVKDPYGQITERAVPVSAYSRPPVMSVKAPSTIVRVGSEALIDASASTDPDSKISMFRFDTDSDAEWEFEQPQAQLRWACETYGDRKIRVQAIDEWGVTSSVASVTVRCRA